MNARTKWLVVVGLLVVVAVVGGCRRGKPGAKAPAAPAAQECRKVDETAAKAEGAAVRVIALKHEPAGAAILRAPHLPERPGDDPCPRSNGVVWPGGCLWYLQAEVLRARAEARAARQRERKAVNEQVAQEVRRRATGEFRGALENAIDGLKDARESLVALEAKITKEKI